MLEHRRDLLICREVSALDIIQALLNGSKIGRVDGLQRSLIGKVEHPTRNRIRRLGRHLTNGIHGLLKQV